jgi:tRNA1Val (adenine37-N6)-methyltransferase
MACHLKSISLDFLMGSLFRFKRFEVDQQGCAMKINTDGVLLGGVVLHTLPLDILDIGTGTGVIAMMLAQRFDQAKVDAVEIDMSAAATAGKNFLHSPFAGRITIYPVSFEEFDTAAKYDLIVSNPPYFVNDLKNQEKRKEIARHTHEDFFDLLLRKAAKLLKDSGSLWLILPVKQAEKVVVNAVLYQLFPSKIIHIHSDAAKDAFRQIICLDFKNDRPLLQEHIYIYEAEGIYTDQYKKLLRDFFLAF